MLKRELKKKKINKKQKIKPVQTQSKGKYKQSK